MNIPNIESIFVSVEYILDDKLTEFCLLIEKLKDIGIQVSGGIKEAYWRIRCNIPDSSNVMFEALLCELTKCLLKVKLNFV